MNETDFETFSFCRFCLQTADSMEEIFNSHAEYILEVEDFTGIKIRNDLNVPSLICEECRKVTEILRKFRNTCRRSEFLLRKFFCIEAKEVEQLPDRVDETIEENTCTTVCNVSHDEEETHLSNINRKKRKEQRELLQTPDSDCKESSKNEKRNCKNLIACHICGKQYESSRLNYHLNSHTGSRPYACSYENCGKAFPSPFLLKSHNKICHTDYFPYACDICGRLFKVRTTFLVHRSYHLDPEIPCTLCGKLIRNKRALKKHMMSHTGERPFSCEVCKKSFQNKYTLKVHQRVHTKEKPFACKWCGKSFGYNCLLKAHTTKQHQDAEDGGLVE